jgi:hypothetical protein
MTSGIPGVCWPLRLIDVCTILGYGHTPSAVRRLDADEYQQAEFSQVEPNVRSDGPPLGRLEEVFTRVGWAVPFDGLPRAEQVRAPRLSARCAHDGHIRRGSWATGCSLRWRFAASSRAAHLLYLDVEQVCPLPIAVHGAGVQQVTERVVAQLGQCVVEFPNSCSSSAASVGCSRPRWKVSSVARSRATASRTASVRVRSTGWSLRRMGL